MYTLMVSFDCGISYEPFMKSEKTQELIDRTEKKGGEPWEDITWTRWYIDDENGKHVNKILCPIHRSVFRIMKEINKLNKEGERK